MQSPYDKEPGSEAQLQQKKEQQQQQEDQRRQILVQILMPDSRERCKTNIYARMLYGINNILYVLYIVNEHSGENKTGKA